MTFNPYLNFNGNTEEAFNFYKSVFGGEFIMLQRFGETGEAENLTESDKQKIMHVALRLNDHTILMATDMLESMGQKLVAGNNFSLSIDTESKDEADIIFNKLSINGIVEMPMQKTFWGAYFGIFKDQFDIQWMINFDEKSE